MELYEERLHRENKSGTTWERDYIRLHGTRWGRNYTKKGLHRKRFCKEELHRNGLYKKGLYRKRWVLKSNLFKNKLFLK